jgi:hypothetical protein
MNEERTGAGDPALAPFLAARGEEEARERLGELLTRIAAPLVGKVLRRQLADAAPEDLEDLQAGALLRIQLQLAALRSGEREPMASFPDYVAVVAFNAVSAHLMAREPERTRLRQRVRYVLRKGGAVALWSAAGHETHCGLAAWSGRPAVAAGSALGAAAWAAAGAVGREPAAFARLVAAALERFGAPCRFEDLVEALAGVLDVRDDVAEPLLAGRDESDSAPAAPEISDAAPGADQSLAARQALALLWSEIARLPARQRAALLLNLRDDGGGEMTGALLATGVVDLPALAAALELGTDEVGALLPNLPLEDLRIAERLGLTRQQVINLRKSARLRLARRMRGILPGMGG